MAQSLEVQSKIAAWRARSQGVGPPMTLEDYKAAILALRGDRVHAAAESPAGKRKKAIAEVPNADDLLNELDGLK